MKIQKEYWFVVISATLSGFIVFGGQVFFHMGFSVAEISILTYLIPLILLTPFILLNRKLFFRRAMIPYLLVYGLIDSGINICQFAAPVLGASVAMTLLLLYAQPLWTTIYSFLFLKEKITVKEIVACLLVLIGIIILVNPFNAGDSTLAGTIVALLGGVFLSGWVISGSIISKKGNAPLNTIYGGGISMMIILALLYPLARHFFPQGNLTAFDIHKGLLPLAAILAFGLICFLVNHFFYLKGTKKVRTVDAGIIMLLEPIVGAVLAMIFLRQPLTLGIVIGGILIITANYLVIAESRNH